MKLKQVGGRYFCPICGSHDFGIESILDCRICNRRGNDNVFDMCEELAIKSFAEQYKTKDSDDDILMREDFNNYIDTLELDFFSEILQYKGKYKTDVMDYLKNNIQLGD